MISLIPYSTNDMVASYPKIVKEGGYNIKFTYLHGKLCDDFGDDYFEVSGDDITQCVGEHYLEYNNKTCILFVWYSFPRLLGLCVYEDDIEALEYARYKYNEKSCVI